MAKLYAEITSDKGNRTVSKGGNEFINVQFKVKNKVVGNVELYIFNDMEDGCDDDEYLLKFYRNDDEDPFIISQGNL